MKKLYVCIIVLSSLYPVKYSFANTKYVYNENERQCFLQKNNQKILVAGANEKTYFYFPCSKIITTYETQKSKEFYLISELLLATSPKENQRYIRIIKDEGNKSYDDTQLSYLLSSCIQLKKTNNRDLVNYIVDKKNNLEKICSTDDGLISINKKIFLYDKVGNNFKIQRSYLIKSDKIKVIDYFFKNKSLWLYINYNDSVKKWIPSNSIDL